MTFQLYGKTYDADITLTAGHDTFTGNTGERTVVRAGDGSDVINMQSPTSNLYSEGDLIYAGGGDDFVFMGNGSDVVKLGSGDDEVYGGGGNDRLLGEAGDDFIVGGTGNDVMTGGAGADTFVFADASQNGVNSGFDTISDFNSADDSLHFDTTSVIDDIFIHGSSGRINISYNNGNDRIILGDDAELNLSDFVGEVTLMPEAYDFFM